MHDDVVAGDLEVRLRGYFETESAASRPAAHAILVSAAVPPRRRAAIRFAPVGGGVLALAAIVLAIAVLPMRNVPGAVPPIADASSPAVAGSPTSPASAASPEASAGASGVTYANGIPVEIDGERMYSGAEIATRRVQPGSFLAVGVLNTVVYDCMEGTCPASSTWILSDPKDPHANGIALLAGGGTWAPPAGMAKWPGELVVLRVRGYGSATELMTCPWGNFCANALLVEAVVPPR